MKATLYTGLLCVMVAAAAETQPAQQSGKYQLTLRLPPDGLRAGEEMEFEFRLQDTSVSDPLTGFAPVIRAAVRARISMPEMPGMPPYEESAHPEGVPGDYGFHPTFAHGGHYRLQLTVTPPVDSAFTVEFPLAVGDPVPAANRKARPTRYTMEISTTPKRPKAGEPAEIGFVFHDRENPKQIFNAFETVHESLFHLVMVRADLSQFAHEHPAIDDHGTFRLRYTFPVAGEYHLFADIAPKGAGSQLLMAKLTVSGPAAPRFDIRTAPQSSISHGIELASTSFPSKKTVPVAVTVKDERGRIVNDLEPYLGASGHFLLLHEDALTFVHSHPDETEPGRAGRLQFLARFPKPGLYRGWVQVKRGGQLVTADFILRAEAALE